MTYRYIVAILIVTALTGAGCAPAARQKAANTDTSETASKKTQPTTSEAPASESSSAPTMTAEATTETKPTDVSGVTLSDLNNLQTEIQSSNFDDLSSLKE